MDGSTRRTRRRARPDRRWCRLRPPRRIERASAEVDATQRSRMAVPHAHRASAANTLLKEQSALRLEHRAPTTAYRLTMESRPLARSDIHVSLLGLGCSRIGGTVERFDRREALEVIRHAFESGINFFD